MTEKMDVKLKKCQTPKFRVSYPAVFEPRAYMDQPAKYSVTMLFSKKTDISALRKCAENAMIEKYGKDKKKWPAKLKDPFRDGDEEFPDAPGYQGVIFVKASSKKKPGLCPAHNPKEVITDPEEFYAGCFARATIIARVFDVAGNKGVSFSLLNIQKLGDGEPLGGRTRTEDDFDAVESEADDETNYSDNDL